MGKEIRSFGTRPLTILEIKHKTRLSNGMWCVIGYIPGVLDGISADVYRDKKLRNLVFMQHRYHVYGLPKDLNRWSEQNYQVIVSDIEARCQDMGL